MAVKSITIGMDAHERLARLNRTGQSFSQVIKKHLPALLTTAGDLLDRLDQTEISVNGRDPSVGADRSQHRRLHRHPAGARRGGPVAGAGVGCPLGDLHLVANGMPDRLGRAAVDVVFLVLAFAAAFEGGWLFIPAGITYLVLDLARPTMGAPASERRGQ